MLSSRFLQKYFDFLSPIVSEFFLLHQGFLCDDPLQRVWIKLPVLVDLLVFPRALELLDVLRNLPLSRNGILCLTSCCVKTLPQVSLHWIGKVMNLTRNFL